MKRELLLTCMALGVGLTGGVAGGAAIVAWSEASAERGGGAHAAGDALTPRTAAASGETEKKRRIEELENELSVLAGRLRRLEAADGTSREPVAGWVTPEQLEALRMELRAELQEAEPARPDPASPQFKEQVAETLSGIRKEEAIEKVREEQERRYERLDRDVAKLGAWLSLTPYQTDEMRRALSAQYEREHELRRRWEAGEDETLLGETKRRGRATLRRDLAAFLDVDQAERLFEHFGLVESDEE